MASGWIGLRSVRLRCAHWREALLWRSELRAVTGQPLRPQAAPGVGSGGAGPPQGVEFHQQPEGAHRRTRSSSKDCGPATGGFSPVGPSRAHDTCFWPAEAATCPAGPSGASERVKTSQLHENRELIRAHLLRCYPFLSFFFISDHLFFPFASA